MSTSVRKRLRAYGFDNPLQDLAPLPIISRRDPQSSDKGFPLGTPWINEPSNHSYILTSVAGGQANWEPVSQSAGGNAPISKYIVDADGTADYVVIQEALDAANAAGKPATIIVRPGTYNENLTLYSNLNIFGTSTYTVIINGVHTPPDTGVFSIWNVGLQSATHIFNSTNAGSANLTLVSCVCNVTNGYTFNLPNWTGILFFYGCGSIGTNDGAVNNTGGAQIEINQSTIGAGTSNILIASNGIVNIENAKVKCPSLFGGTATVKSSMGSYFGGTVSTADAATVTLLDSVFLVGSQAAVNHNSSNNITLCQLVVDSSAVTPMIGSGTGFFQMMSIIYLDTRRIATSLLQVFLPDIGKPSPYVVGPTGTFQEIQAAINAANPFFGAKTIYIQDLIPNWWVENLDFRGSAFDQNILLKGLAIDGDGLVDGVTIFGHHTLPDTGRVTAEDIYFQTGSGDDLFTTTVTGTSDNLVTLRNCQLNTVNGLLFNIPNYVGNVRLFNSRIVDPTKSSGISNNTGGATFFIRSSTVGTSTGSGSVFSGNADIDNSRVLCPVDFQAGSSLDIRGTKFSETTTLSGTATGEFNACDFNTGSNVAITMNSSGNINLENCTVKSSNNPAISGSGTGTFTLAGIDFLNNSNIAGTLTIAAGNTRNGEFIATTPGKGLSIAEGANARMGTAILAGGIATVPTTVVTANSRIYLTIQFPAGTVGSPYVSTRISGVNFTINSTSGADASTVAWMIVEPA